MSAPRRARGPLGLVVQSTGFMRKELVELVRRPRLLLTLVVGPFLLLVVFGNSYRQNGARLRTVFVGADGSAYQAAVDTYRDDLSRHVQVEGFTTDRAGAVEDLVRGRVDLVVVFPDDAAADVLDGRHAEVLVLNDKIDPVQRAAVEIAAQLAVNEVNASIMAGIVGEAQEQQQPAGAMLETTLHATDALARAVSAQDPRAIDAASVTAGAAVTAMRSALGRTTQLISGVDSAATDARRSDVAAVDEELARLDQLIAETRDGRSDPAAAQRRMDELRGRVEELRPRLDALGRVDSAVLVRPFTSVTRTVLPQPIGVTAFFAPSSIALLLQHLALSFAALSIVRDRRMGLLEIYRVGPTSVLAITVGRFLAFLVAGAAVGALLLVAVNVALDVPLLGPLWWVAVAIGLLLGAAIALGMLVALVSGSDSEVVQYAMLVLLASLFFGGFVLDLRLFDTAGRFISWLLPVTFAIRVLQDVMLRDASPAGSDLLALAAQVAVYGAAAVVLFRRRLRTS